MRKENIYLTTTEVCELEGVDYDIIKKRRQRGTLKATKIEVKNHQGFEYRIELQDISKKAQAKYYSKLKNDSAEQLTLETLIDTQKNYKDLTLLDLTKEQRDEALFWDKTLKEWQSFIMDCHKNKTEKTKEFIEIFNVVQPYNKITQRTLYRKLELYRSFGIVALADDRRQGNRNGTTIDDKLYSVDRLKTQMQ